MAQDGFARAIYPVHTPLDGDLVFAAATGAMPLADPVIAASPSSARWPPTSGARDRRAASTRRRALPFPQARAELERKFG